jgi:hypothetical protein
MGAAEIVAEKPSELGHSADRDAVLADLCKQAGISPKFYLNRADVSTASEMTAEDYAACLEAVRRKIKSAQDRAEQAA